MSEETNNETTEQSVTTVLSKDAIDASSVALADVLYLIHGTGSDRDRTMTMEVLRDWIAAHLDNVDVTFEDVTADSVTVPGNGMSTTISEQLIKMLVGASARDVQIKADEIKFTDDSGTHAFHAKFGRAGLTITDNDTFSFVISSGGAITITQGNKVVTVNKDGVSVTDGTSTATLTKDGPTGKTISDIPKSQNAAGPNMTGTSTPLAYASLPITISLPSAVTDGDIGEIISTWVGTDYKTQRSSGASTYIIVNDTSSERTLTGFYNGSGSTISIKLPAYGNMTVVRIGNNYYGPAETTPVV